jgi:hypothetical protein
MGRLYVSCNEVVVAYFKVPSEYVRGWTEEKFEKSQAIPAQKMLETLISRIPSTYMVHSDGNRTFATAGDDKQNCDYKTCWRQTPQEMGVTHLNTDIEIS